MSVVITAPAPNGKRKTKETVILLRYSNASEPMPETEIERRKRAIARGRGVETSELTVRRVGE